MITTQKEIELKWVEVEGEDFWALDDRGKWTGYTIAKLSPYFAKPNQPVCFHIRYSPQNKDLDSVPTLEDAKVLAEQYYKTL